MWIRILISAFIAALIFVPPLWAQEKPAETFRDVYDPPQSLDTRIDVDFPGGTVPELLALIEKTNGIKPNVIVSREAASLTFPPFSLRGATIYETVAGLKELGMVDNFYLRAQRNQNVMTLMAEDRNRQAAQMREARATKIYSVGEILSGSDFGIDDIVTSIETAWKMHMKDHTASLKYHDETKLLIAVGYPEELHMVQQVLEELIMAKNTARAREERKTTTKTLQQLSKVDEELITAIQALEAENAQIKKDLAELARRGK